MFNTDDARHRERMFNTFLHFLAVLLKVPLFPPRNDRDTLSVKRDSIA